MEIDLRDWELPYFPSKTVLDKMNSKASKVIIRESSSNIIKSELVLRLTKTFLTRGKSLKSCFLKPYTRPLFRFCRPILVDLYASFCTHLCTDICADFCRPILIDSSGKKKSFYISTMQALWLLKTPR